MAATMHGWYEFWMANFFVAGSAFGIIALIVMVRGVRDLRQMFTNLREQAKRPQ